MTQRGATMPGGAGRIGGGLMRMPCDQRALFELLALFEGEAGLDSWLRRIDLSQATPLHLYHMAHRRPPDSIEAAMVLAGFEPLAPLGAALLSEEFRENAVLNLLHAFPELRRFTVLAVPGVEADALFTGLASVQAVLRHRLAVADPEPAERFLDQLARLARGIVHGGDIAAECTAGLERYEARTGHRPHDRLLVVIDDPVSVMVGQARQAVERLRREVPPLSPRAQAVSRALGVTRIAPSASPDELRRLAERALTNTALCQPNAICRTLSHTAAKDFQGALAAAAIFDIEITTRADLPAWLLERRGVVSLPPPQATWPVLSEEAAIEAFAEDLLDATVEDRRFHALVTWGLEQTGRPSIGGQELVRLAGAETLRAIAASVFTPTPASRYPARIRRPSLPDPVVARGPVAVSDLLSRHAAAGIHIGFGEGGTSQDHVGVGWSGIEPEARWTHGPVASFVLPRPPGPGPFMLRIDAAPFVVPGSLPSQRVGVQVNGHAVAITELSERALLECPIAERLLSDERQLSITLNLPDATAPRDVGATDDDRVIALFVREVMLAGPSGPVPTTIRRIDLPPPSPPTTRALPDLPLAELAIRFESIGENCEFGLLQRRWGAEPLGLLRFASSPPDKLLPALRRGFAGMGDDGQLEVELHGGREYMVLDRRYGFLYHAWALLGEMTPEEILTREHRRLPFLIRKLMEDIADGEKLFVYHAMRPLNEAEAVELSDVIGSYGRGTLLWMELAEPGHPAGSVIRINDRLLKGHMDRFAPGENAHDISVDCWVEVCRNALRESGRW